MVWWNQQIIVNKEAIKEMDLQQKYHIDANSEALVTSENIIVQNTRFALLAKVVVVDETGAVNAEEAESDCRNV